MKNSCLRSLTPMWLATARLIVADNPAAVIENDVLRVALAPDDA